MAHRDVAVVIHEGVQALDVAGPLDVFAAANDFLMPADHYRCFVVGKDGAPVRSSNGMRIVADLGFDDACRPFHTVLVAGGPSMPDRGPDPLLSEWLREWGSRAERYGSICNGTFALGHAGLLDGRTVTTHWLASARLAAGFPRARVEPDRIHVRDDRLVSSAGVTAGIDLALALVAEDHGAATSLACAKALVVMAQRQGGQSQFSPLLLRVADGASPLGRVQAYVMEHLSEAFPVERLAQIAGVSLRSVARLFAQGLGTTPHDFIESIRIDQARNLLEASDTAIKVVAFECGFGNPDLMRSAFQRRLGVTPVQYRERFRAS
ncbi:GlxA family transcriptional regulator [Acetobacteraceae bacterium KSS8]|uniref:GlxA family transcriptional regulator n=1 Tax=Endosaccharibacter trunci TaxID=2812733 RepID=A0ABT1W6P8_9PROT|nr:GlxA family transcriptional regulator [Acetobacteraceae bacterium KSS8]